MTPRFFRRHRERQAALAGAFPETGETTAEILARARPARYDARGITFEGASLAGLPVMLEDGPYPELDLDAIAALPDPYPERRSPDYCWRSWPPRHTGECGCPIVPAGWRP